MKRSWWLSVFAVTALALVALYRPPASEPNGSFGLVDQVHLDYRADEPGSKVHAALTGTLTDGPDGLVLSVLIDAQGPAVDPVPGFRGIRGTNITTAVEMAEILETGNFAITAQSGATGTLTATRWAHLPERRLDRNGNLDLDARTVELLPAGVTVRAGPLGPNDDVVLRVDGRPRLLAKIRTRDGRTSLSLVNPDESSQ